MSGANIGSLNVDLGMESASFSTKNKQARDELKKTEASFKSSASAIESRITAIGGTLGSVAAGFGVAGFAAATKAVLDFADDLGTAADQAGVSVERYQTLKEGLRSLEIGTEATDKTLKTLTDTIGKVQSGVSDAATKAFDRLGLTAKIMSGEITTADEALDAIADGAKGAGSQAQFTTDLVDILGKKIGVDMAAALRDGGVALHDAEQAFRDTGSVISTEMIQRLADANEQIDSFAARSKQTLTIWAAEAIGRFDDFYRTALNFSRSMAKLAPLPGMGSVADYDAAIKAIDARQGDARFAALNRQFALPKGSRFRPLVQPDIIVNGDPGRLKRTGTGGGGGRSASVRSSRSSQPDYGPDISNIDPRERFGFASLDTLGSSDIRGSVDAVQSGIDDWRHAQDEIYDHAQDRVRDVADVFENAMTGAGGNFLDQFKRMGISAVAEIAARLVTNNGGQGGGLGGILKGVLGIGSLFGGGGGGFASVVPSVLGIGPIGNPTALGGLNLNIPQFANGGSLKIGGFAGIDRNVLSLNDDPIARVSAGEVLDIGKAGGGRGGVTIHIDAKDAVLSSTVRQWVAEGMQQAAIAGAQGGSAMAMGQIRRAAKYRLPGSGG